MQPRFEQFIHERQYHALKSPQLKEFSLYCPHSQQRRCSGSLSGPRRALLKGACTCLCYSCDTLSLLQT
jgi:hypothetical protein